MTVRKIPQRILETMKPEFRKKVRELMTEAFALAGFIEEPKLLEDLWDELSKDFSGDPDSAERILADHETTRHTEDIDEVLGEIDEASDADFGDFDNDPLADQATPNTNLVTGKPLPTTNRAHRSFSHPRQHSGPMSPGGRPISQYKGVSWSGGGKPWRARHLNHTLGHYHSEEEAARAYDSYIWRIKKSTSFMNFPEAYTQ